MILVKGANTKHKKIQYPMLHKRAERSVQSLVQRIRAGSKVGRVSIEHTVVFIDVCLKPSKRAEWIAPIHKKSKVPTPNIP